jgi:hypothetical protein
MISALIQSEAAILAIVITLSLVAVQQSASSYSPRVIEIFKDPNENPDLWILISIYTVSMIYGTFILKILNGDGEKLSDFQSHIWFTYWLGVLAFTSLKSYTSNTLKLITPSNIIEKLSNRIYRVATDNSYEKTTDELLSPINSIIDIINSSLLKYDYETAKTGIKSIKENIHVVVENGKIDNEIRDEIQQKIIFDFKRIAILSINQWDKDSINEIIEYFHSFGIKNYDETESANFKALVQTIESLNEIGKQAAQKNMADEVGMILETLGKIGILVVQSENLDASYKVMNSVEIIGIEAVKQGMAKYEKLSVETLQSIGNSAIQKRLDGLGNKAICHIEKIGMFAIKQNDGDLINHPTLQSLLDIGIEIIEEQNKVVDGIEEKEENIVVFDQALTSVFLSLENIAKEAGKQKNMEDVIDVIGRNLERIQGKLTSSFGNIVKLVSILKEKKSEQKVLLAFSGPTDSIINEIMELILSLREVGITAARAQTDGAIRSTSGGLKNIGVSLSGQEPNVKISKEDIEKLLTRSSSSLKEIGFELCKYKNRGDAIKVVINNLKDIGIEAAKSNKENSVENVVKYLNNIGLKLLEQKKGELSIETLSCIKEIINNSSTLPCLPVLEENFKEFKDCVLSLINRTSEGLDRVNKLKNIKSLG